MTNHGPRNVLDDTKVIYLTDPACKYNWVVTQRYKEERMDASFHGVDLEDCVTFGRVVTHFTHACQVAVWRTQGLNVRRFTALVSWVSRMGGVPWNDACPCVVRALVEGHMYLHQGTGEFGLTPRGKRVKVPQEYKDQSPVLASYFANVTRSQKVIDEARQYWDKA